MTTEIKDTNSAEAVEGLTLLGMDDVMEMNLDDTEDLPDYVNPPSGAYMLIFKAAPKLESYKHTDKTTKAVSMKSRIRAVYAVASTVSTVAPDGDRVADGSLFSESFSIPEGLPYFKRHAVALLGKDNIKGVQLKDIFAELGKQEAFEAIIKSKETKATDGTDKILVNTNVRIVSKFPDDTASMDANLALTGGGVRI